MEQYHTCWLFWSGLVWCWRPKVSSEAFGNCFDWEDE